MGNQILCTVHNISKQFGRVRAVEGLNFDLCSGEIVSIIGPSGAGKTTLLRLMAGLETPDAGEIRYSEDIPKEKNPAVLVFQDFLLFPGMTVAANVGFGLRAARLPRTEIQKRTTELLEAFGIPDKAHDYPAQLSAGQQQRVALARAIAVRPRVLLLDEPFAHLDKALKMDTALYLRRILQQFGITAMAVTHDLQEAFAMSDRVGIMIHGTLMQFGPVAEVYSNPASLTVAEFLGPVNRFPAALLHAVSHDRSLQPLRMLPPDTPLFCRAESVRIEPHPEGEALIESVTFIGVLVLYQLRIETPAGSCHLRAFSLENGLHPGDTVRTRITHAIHDKEHSNET
ncbi:MAG: ABC transporter ATP-binding protein [Spirochaeta sp.]